MTTFVLDSNNNITAHADQASADKLIAKMADGAQFESFGKFSDLEALKLPNARLVEIWNSFAGLPGPDSLQPDGCRLEALHRLELLEPAIQRLAAAQSKPEKEKSPRKARKPAPAKRGAPKREQAGSTKKAEVIAMISKEGGATLAAIMKATDWQPHTVRGFMATLGKTEKVVSEKVDGERTYAIR